MTEAVVVMSEHADGPKITSIFSDNIFVVHNVLRVSTFSANLIRHRHKNTTPVPAGWLWRSQNT